jgi:hypothetical protein
MSCNLLKTKGNFLALMYCFNCHVLSCVVEAAGFAKVVINHSGFKVVGLAENSQGLSSRMSCYAGIAVC